MSTLVETIEYRLSAPKVQLTGFDDALTKMRAMRSEIGAINAAIAGLSTNSLLKRTRAELTDVFKGIPGGKKTVNVEAAAAAAGIPNIADFQAYLARWRSKARDEVRKFFSESTGKEFRSPERGAELTQKYLTSVLRRQPSQSNLASLFGGGGGGSLPSNISSGGAITITAAQVILQAGAVTGGSVPGGGGGAGGGGGGTATGGGIPSGGGGALLESRETLTQRGRSVRRRELVKLGEQVDNFYKEVDGALEATKQVTTSSPLKKLRDKLSRQLSDLNAQLQAQLGGTIDPTKVATLYRKQADLYKALAGGETGKQLEKLGLGSLVSKANDKAAGFERRAGQLELRSADAKARELARAQEQAEQDRLRQHRQRLNLIRNSQRQEDQLENRSNADALRFQKQKANADTAALKARQRAADNMAKLAMGEAIGNLSHGEANAALATLAGAGFDIGRAQRSARLGAGGRRHTDTVTATKEDLASGEMLTTRVKFHFENGRAVGAEVSELNRKLKDTRAEAGALGGDFIRNTIKVTAWSASVAVLYQSLALAKAGMAALIDTGAQMARLDQVFTQVGGGTRNLADDVVHLAAVNGRSRSEAMEAAIEWSRLGFSRRQVNEGVRSSLYAANIAELSAGEATQKLIGIMSAYQMRIEDVRTVLAEMNAVSNTSRVKVADLFEVFARSSSVARAAGLSWQELVGLSAATIERTGQQPGTVGNMVKTVISRMSDANLQKNLRDQFRFEVTADGGASMKNFSQILSDLFVKYQDLSEAQRQSLLYQVAGATQVNRVSALLDSYVRAQILAINAQLNLNSAEEENAKIKATLRSQLAGLTTEWERFVAIQGNRGPQQALSGIATTMRNLFAVMNTSGGSGLATGMLAVLTAAAAKVALVGIQMKGAAGSAGFLGNTTKRVVEAMAGLNALTQRTVTGFASRTEARMTGASSPLGQLAGMPGYFMGQGAQKLFVWGESASRAAAAMRAAGTSGAMMFSVLGMGLKTLSAATVALGEFLVPILLIYGAMKLFNMGMEAIGMSSDKAAARLAGFNEEASRAKEAAGAFTQAANLFNTADRAMKNMRNPDQRGKFMNEVLEAAVADEPDERVKARKLKSLREEFAILEQNNDAEGRSVRLQELRAEALRKAFNERQREFEANRKFVDENRAEVERLRSKSGVPFGQESRKQKIDELEKDSFQRRAQMTQTLLEESDALQQRLDADEKHNTSLERQKLALQSIAEFYRSIPTDTRAGAGQMELLALETQQRALVQQRATLEQNMEVARRGDFERAQSLKEIENRLTALRTEYEALRKTENETAAAAAAAGAGGEMAGDSTASERMRQQIEELERQRQSNTNTKTTDEISLEKQLQLIENQTRELRKQEAALRSNLALLEAQDRLRFGQRQAQIDLIPDDFGASDIERLLNRRQGIAKAMAGLTPEMTATLQGRAKLIEYENQLYQVQWELRTKVKEAERQINQIIVDRNKEFRNSLMMAGPGELLRKLAAMQMNSRPGGVGMGQFLTLGGGMRGDLQNLNPQRFDPAIWDLRRGIQNAGPQPNDFQFFEQQKKLQQLMIEAAAQFKDILPPAINEAAQANMELAIQARGAAAALQQIPEIVQQMVEMFTGEVFDQTPMDGQMRGQTVGRGR